MCSRENIDFSRVKRIHNSIKAGKYVREWGCGSMCVDNTGAQQPHMHLSGGFYIVHLHPAGM